ncbi:MAG: hypothetical protein ABJI22_15145 [Maribacter sp.]
MNKFLTSLIFVLISFSTCGQVENEYLKLIKEANTYYEQKEFQFSLNKFEQAFDIVDKNNTDLYNAACSSALLGQSEKAITFLKKAIDNGWNNIDHLQKDPDLYKLHCLDNWGDVVKYAKENNSKTLTDSQLIDKITSLIKSNDSNLLWELCSIDYRNGTNKSSFIEKIQSISTLLKKENINSLNSVRNGKNNSLKYLNGIQSRTSDFSYLVIPNYYKGFVKKLLTKPTGSNIKIQLTEKNNKWFLSELTFQNNYFDSKNNIQDEISNFFKNQDSLFFRFSIEKNNQVFVSQKNIKKEEINTQKTKYSGRIVYLPLSDLEKSSNKIFTDSTKIHAMSYIAYSGQDNQIFKKATNRFEFIFFKNNTEIVLISNGTNYAFYKVKFLKDLTDLITLEIYNATK